MRRGFYPFCLLACLCLGSCYNLKSKFEDTTSFVEKLADPATCAPPANGPCAKCFADPMYDDLKLEVGAMFSNNGQLESISRQYSPMLEINNWVAMEIHTAAARMLLSEFMGYNVRTIVRDDLQGAYPRVANGIVDMLLELWDASKKDDRVHYVRETGEVEHGGMLGTFGRIGLYLPKYMINSERVVEYYRSLHNAVNLNAFSPDGTLPTSMLRRSNGHWWCSNVTGNPWTTGACTDGKYVPPQCLPLNSAGVSPHCKEVLLVNPWWDQGYFEALIKNTGLNFTLNYIGYGGLLAEVARRSAAQQPFLMYWWEPEGLLERFNMTKMIFEENSPGCAAQNTRDPFTSGIHCDQEVQLVAKIVHPRIKRTQPDLYSFFQNYFISTDDQRAMLALHTSGGGQLHTDAAACAWLKDNVNVWKGWIHNTRAPCAADAYNRTVTGCVAGERRVSFQWKAGVAGSSCYPDVPGSVSLPPPLSIPCEYVQASDASVSGLLAAALLLLAAALLLAVVVVAKRRHFAIRRSQPKFLLMMLLGACLCYLSLLLFVGQPTAGACVGRTLLLSGGLTLMFGALLVKTYRIYKIFENAKMRQVVITDRQLLLKMGLLLAADALLLLLWLLLAAPTAADVALPVAGSDPIHVVACVETGSAFPQMLLFVFHALQLCAACYLSLVVRGVQADFHEARHVLLSSYNSALTTLILLPLLYLLPLSAAASFTLVAAALLFGVTGCIWLVLLPKLAKIVSGQAAPAVTATGGRGGTAGRRGGASSTFRGSTINVPNATGGVGGGGTMVMSRTNNFMATGDNAAAATTSGAGGGGKQQGGAGRVQELEAKVLRQSVELQQLRQRLNASSPFAADAAPGRGTIVLTPLNHPGGAAAAVPGTSS